MSFLVSLGLTSLQTQLFVPIPHIILLSRTMYLPVFVLAFHSDYQRLGRVPFASPRSILGKRERSFVILVKVKHSYNDKQENVATISFVSLVKKPKFSQGSNFSVCPVELFSLTASVAVCPPAPGMATYTNTRLALLISYIRRALLKIGVFKEINVKNVSLELSIVQLKKYLKPLKINSPIYWES